MTTQSTVIPIALIASAFVFAPAPSRAQAIAPLSDRVKAAVEEALQDEYRGEASYKRALEDHGEVRPFSHIVHAERRHAILLEEVLAAHGLPLPEHRETATVAPAPAGVREACAAAVEFETTNVALYDRLLSAGPLPEKVKQVFDHNRIASLSHHKPAFERCAGATSSPAAGHGCGGERGRGRRDEHSAVGARSGGRQGSGCGHHAGCQP